MPRREAKRYQKPRKIFDAALIKEENNLINRYGLKNRREVWKAAYTIGKIRDIAKKLITATSEEQEKFVARQRAKGFDVTKIADVLALNKEDSLKRRLQSIIVSKKLAKTHKQARQLITHKHISIKGHIINSPSHLTTLEEESEITLNLEVPVEKVISKEEKEILKHMNHNSELKENKEDK
jgi:small subunit ribosomal protein S4